MTIYPSAPQNYQNKLALDYTHSQVAYVGYEGSVFHISGPFAPILGAQSGVVMQQIAHLDAPFKHLDNKGARQDGTTWYDSLYDPAEIDMIVELGGTDPASTRRVIADWFGAWDPKKLGKLCWFSPERGEWWCSVRMNKPVQDSFKADWYQSHGTAFTWSCRNDDAFWRSVDSVNQFDLNHASVITFDEGVTGGTFDLTVLGQTVTLPFGSTASDIQSGLAGLSTVGTGNVSVSPLGGSGSIFSVVFQLALGAIDLVGSFFGSFLNLLGGGGSVTPTQPGGPTASGHITLTNIGDQPAWPRYLLYGPGTFSIADGPGSQNFIEFGPLKENQVALLTTLPRLQGVIDVTPTQTPDPNQGSGTTSLIQTLINFVTNNNIPPLLEEFESFFGIQPPQGPFYSLLNGRFTTPVPPMLEGVGPQAVSIPCKIVGGNANSKIIASLTPMRRWPE